MWKIERKEKRPGSIWNPVNLQKEVHAFGYNFYWKTYFLTILCMLSLIIAVSVFFQLQVKYIFIVIAASFGLLPVLIMNMYKRMYEQKRFSDIVDYMEQILYSFEKEHKILKALKECKDALPDGRMKQAVNDAISYIESGGKKGEENLYGEALGIIEKRYFCSRLHMVHELLISAEERGGEMEKSANLMIEDIEVWKRQVYGLQKNKKAYHMDCVLSIIMAAFVCGLDMYIMNSVKDMTYTGEDVSIFGITAVQITSFIFMLLCLVTFYKSSKKLAEDWMEQIGKSKKMLKSSYEYVMGYDEGKERRKSLLFAIPLFFATIICYLKISKIFGTVFFVAGCFVILQHKFSYSMSKKEVEKALYKMFSSWMMDMALLLQTNNVQVSIAKSISRSGDILQEELNMLLKRITDNPEDVKAYLKFCEKFNIPEITTCMKMLYSISVSGTGNGGEQITNLIGHVHKMQEKEAELQNEDISFKMHMICAYPVVGTSGKLLVDMLMGTLLIFQLFQKAM